jgi:hypothetical protein
VKDENGDLLADSHNISYRWKKYLSQLLTVHNVRDVRQSEVNTAEPLIPGASGLEVEIATAKLKKHKSPGRGLIPAELIKAGGEIFLPAIHKLINSIRGRQKFPSQCNNYRGVSLLSTLCTILSNILSSKLSPYIDEIIGAHQCGFRRNKLTIDQNFCIRQILEKKCDTMRHYISNS